MNSSLPDDIPLGAIVSIINRGKFIFLNDRLRPLDLSAGQFPVLMLLYKEQNITQDTLVRHYHLDKGTIARAVRLFLTEKGEQVIPVLKEIHCEWDERVFTGMSHGDRTTIMSLMRRIAQSSCQTICTTGDCTHAGE